jgi:hypothetical protein
VKEAAAGAPRDRFKRIARAVLGLAITVVTLYVVYRDSDPREILNALANFNLVMLLPFGILYAIQLWAKTERWAQLLERGSVRLRVLFSTMMVGYTINTLLPARLGEVARIYLLHKRANVPAGRTLSTIVFERLLDVATVVLLLGIALLSVDFPESMRFMLLLGTVLLIVGLAGLVLVALLPPRLYSSIIERAPILMRVPFKGTIEAGFTLLVEVVRTRRGVLAFGWSIPAWLTLVAGTHFVLLGFGLDVPIWASMVLVGATSLGMTLPSSPGYVGVFHWLAAESLALFGVAESAAETAALVLHIVGFAPVTLLGLYYVWADGLGSIGGLARESKHLED